MIRSGVCGAIAAVLLWPVSAWSFDPDGHHTIGAIADQLLAGTPAGAAVTAELGGMSLEQASGWADCAKSTALQSNGTFVYPDKGRPECSGFDTPYWRDRFQNFVKNNWAQCGTSHDSQHCHDQYHYTDVSSRREHYDPAYKGTTDHDVVHSINAAVDKIIGQSVPGTFQIIDKKEALILLSHYVGDIHQPLHVAAVYLDASGNVIDPDAVATPVATENDTSGGNLVKDVQPPGDSFHYEWDLVPQDMIVGHPGFQDLVTRARAVSPTQGDVMSWSAQWATESIFESKSVFGGLTFAFTGTAQKPTWKVLGIDANYQHRADTLKSEQIAKAGARLAQLVQLLYSQPSCKAPVATVKMGYLLPAELPDVGLWLPKWQTITAKGQAADDETMNTIGTLPPARRLSAAQDDVLDGESILERFQIATGRKLNRCNAPTLVQMVDRLIADGSAEVASVKNVPDQRRRPLVSIPNLTTCLDPVDLAGHRFNDLVTYKLATTGSYPSTHALTGMVTGMLLADLMPERTVDVYRRGIEFGDSRVVCGFHYPTDVQAGRLAGVALWAREQGSQSFNADLERARNEVQAAVVSGP